MSTKRWSLNKEGILKSAEMSARELSSQTAPSDDVNASQLANQQSENDSDLVVCSVKDSMQASEGGKERQTTNPMYKLPLRKTVGIGVQLDLENTSPAESRQ